MTTTVAVADGIFTIHDDRPVLLGSRCVNCGNHMFPRQSGCPKCMHDDQEDVELATRGTLWTWTVQAFPPKAPPYLGPVGDDFEPYGVGYVELDGQLRVESRLTVSDPDRLDIGMEMELVLVPLTTDEDGNQVVTYGFAPIGDGASTGGDTATTNGAGS
ncbi:Zn-ribbon domain-containing OB-fold protein [Ilumatobacter sp.]|uniref:Zn-ribbon domain-containing OB-fold protein n=1 Tax=Ilumatobacter sp. TaxID=1967498 RepID=UPI003B522C23